jgi:hypothetical protein
MVVQVVKQFPLFMNLICELHVVPRRLNGQSICLRFSTHVLLFFAFQVPTIIKSLAKSSFRELRLLQNIVQKFRF